MFFWAAGLNWSRGQIPAKSLGSVGGRSVNEKEGHSSKVKLGNRMYILKKSRIHMPQRLCEDIESEL